MSNFAFTNHILLGSVNTLFFGIEKKKFEIS